VVLWRLLIIALPIYFTWEMLQMPAFTGLPESWLAATGVCAVAAIGDALIVLVMYGFGVYLFRDPRWFAPLSVRRYAVIVAAGLILQLLVEWVAVHRLALWSYRDVQAVLPWLGLGVLPILQSIILLPLTFWLLGRSLGVRASLRRAG
jgi:hypothetical protein